MAIVTLVFIWAKRKGQGRKLAYPQDFDEEILKWILEKREISNVPDIEASNYTKGPDYD